MTLAWPAIVSNITTPLLSLVDVAITGHFDNAAALGAIAVGGTVFNVIYWLFNFLRMGTSGPTAQAIGAGDNTRQVAILFRALITGCAIGFVILILALPFGKYLISFMDAGSDVGEMANTYFDILIFGAPCVLMNFAIAGWLIGRQDSKATLMISLVTNIANIVVSLFAVYILDAGIKGVAFGTLCAQYISFLFGISLIFIRHKKLFKAYDRSDVSRQIADRREFSRFFSLNSDIFLRTLCLVGVTMWFTHAGASQGDTVLAANAVLMQFFMFFSFFMDGFAFAAEALSGKWYGAGDISGLRAMIKTLFKIGYVISTLFALVYFFGGEYIITLLTDRRDVIAAAKEFLPWAVIVPFAGMSAFLYDGVFVGLTQSRRMLASMSCAVAAYFIAYFVLSPHLANHALWIAFCVYLSMRGIMQYFLLKHWRKSV